MPKKRPSKARKAASGEAPAGFSEGVEEAGEAEAPRGQADPEPRGRDLGFPVVGIGASAGGLEALREFFSGIPSDSGIAFIIVQHLDPNQPSHLADILARDAPGPVKEAEDGARLEPGAFYIIAPNTYLGVKDGRLTFHEIVPEHGIRMPVDFLFRSLAEEFREKAICVILSGTGSDGTLGLRQVRGAGGMAMVQDPETTSYTAMPQNAIATGLVDYILPPKAMGQALLTYVRQISLRAPAKAPIAGKLPESLDTVLNLLLVRAGKDFRGYKLGTIGRRVLRRMGINQIEDLDTYVRRLRQDDEELQKLAKDMLIGVTGFFRDPETFADLQTMAIAPLVAGKSGDDVIRAWVPAAATGEEAYSVAMLIFEELWRSEKGCPVQVFASDVDEDALEVARHGVYPGSIEADVPQERLDRHFTKQDSTYQINKAIRDSVIFTAQDVISSPPFSRLDLVSCRNLLIYLEPEIQEKIVGLFGFALNRGGYLFLGKSDSIARDQDLFETVSKKSKIFRRTGSPRPLADFPILPRGRVRTEHEYRRADLPYLSAGGAVLNQRVLLAHFEAAVVLVDASGRIRHFFGPTQRYLVHPTGDASLDLYSMVGQPLARRLRAAVHRAIENGEVGRLENVVTLPNGNGQKIADVTVHPAPSEDGADAIAAVVFEKPRAKQPFVEVPPPGGREEPEGSAEELEAELLRARQELQTTAEEYETTNEELRAAHEEAMSMNEELQSANEEMETSKEELQSVNEELTTVNSQLREKVDELNKANSDLSNLLVATHIATVFLDRNLRVRRFTPAATDLLNLIGTDIGRPIQHLAQDFDGLNLAETAREVLQRLTPIQSEVRTSQNRWYQMHVMPYRTVEDRIDGVVMTFAEVTDLKQAERGFAEEARLLKTIQETTPSMLAYLDRQLEVLRANSAFAQAVGQQEAQIVGRRLSELWPGSEDTVERLREVIEACRQHDWSEFPSAPSAGRNGAGVRLTASAAPVCDATGKAEGVILSITDVTELEEQRRKTLQAERARAAIAGRLAAETSHRTKNNLAIVAGLLQTQADEAQDQAEALKLREAVTRIRAVAGLQDQMYQQNTDVVEVVAALEHIAAVNREVLAAKGTEIRVIGEPIRLPGPSATDLSVVANELLTNALKYGQATDGKAWVRITLQEEDGVIRLGVWNSGNPIREGFDIATEGGLGLRLVQGIAAEQYNGRVRLGPHDGGTLVVVEVEKAELNRSQRVEGQEQ